MKVIEKQFMLFPPRPDLCQECAVKHEPEFPHNPDSLYYQTKFNMAHKRAATWHDAMAHCDRKMKAAWKKVLAEKGIRV